MLNRTFTPFPVLTTPRLTLRQLTMHDEKAIFTLRSDSEINKYLDRPIANTIDEASNFITRVNELIHNNNALYWAITFSDKNILLGTICLFSFSDEEKTCEIGYELLTTFQGMGIMAEAIEKVIKYTFNTIKVKTIEACCHKDNQASIRLLKKYSFNQAREKTSDDLLYYQLFSPILP